MTYSIPQPYLDLIQPQIRHFDLSEVTVVQGSILGAAFGFLGQLAVTVRGTVHLTPRGVRRMGESEGEALRIYAHEAYHVVQQQDMRWTTWLAVYVLQAAVTVDWRGFLSHLKKFVSGLRRFKLYMIPIPWNVNIMPLENRAHQFSLHVVERAGMAAAGSGSSTG